MRTGERIVTPARSAPRTAPGVQKGEADDRAPASGVRLDWPALPAHVRAAVEAWFNEPVAEATTQQGGFSPGVAARLRTFSGQRAFLKAVGPEPNPDSVRLHRREQRIASALPAEALAPRLLWSFDGGEGDWVALVYEDIDGWQPHVPWRADELDRVLVALGKLSAALTPSPVPAAIAGLIADEGLFRARWWGRMLDAPPPALDPWAARHLPELALLETAAGEAAAGETLLHLDLRADNLLLTPERVVVVDWPHARIGAAWVDIIAIAPSMRPRRRSVLSSRRWRAEAVCKGEICRRARAVQGSQ